jgi:hypothetical protein
MGTKHTEADNVQETPPRDSPSLYTADTVQHVKASPPESFPPPPRRTSSSKKSYWFAVVAVGVAVALIFSVFALVVAQQGEHSGTQVTPTPTTAPATTATTTPGSDITPTLTPDVTQGPQNGPAPVNDPAYWDRVLSTQDTNGKVASVSFANVLNNPTLQALVTVRHSDANSTLDVYVFDKITNARPVQLFKMQGLVKGDAKISYYNSVMTAEVDRNSTLNTGKSSGQWTPDLFREFAWNQGAGTLVQVAFPGLFPDLTRYQAEMDQQQVALGKDSWKNNATQVAQRMAAQLLKWPANATATPVSSGGPQDVDAVVQVKSPNQGSMSINVTLSRLEDNTANLWVVIGVTSGNGLLTINTPVKGDRLSSPTTITGTGSAFEGVIGQAFVLDHLYATIGQAQVLGASNGKTTYSVTVPYTSSFQGGTQEGFVVVSMYSQADGSIATAAMQKVMLG